MPPDHAQVLCVDEKSQITVLGGETGNRYPKAGARSSIVFWAFRSLALSRNQAGLTDVLLEHTAQFVPRVLHEADLLQAVDRGLSNRPRPPRNDARTFAGPSPAAAA